MNIPVHNCSSCGACANTCPRDAISMQLDKEGFYRPVINDDKCIECGACERVCPWNKNVLNPNESSSCPKTIAAYAKDDSVRKLSSSGGLFTVLAEKVLDEGGIVVGVAQANRSHYVHIVVESKKDLTKLRGSKYVQADVGIVYREVHNQLKFGRKVLFSGTPCQVAGLYAALGNNANSSNLFTIDIVCHGVPSVKFFEKYIQELEKNNNSSFEEINFRDKKNGWHGYSLFLQFSDGNSFLEHHSRSKFMRLFLSRICQNVSCDECHYRKLPRVADITLGDYWGISRFHSEMDDDKGTSVVLLNTLHGKKLFDSVADMVVQCDSKIEYAIAGNPCIVRSEKRHPKRGEFFANMDEYSIDQLIKQYCPFPSTLKRLYYRIRGVLGKVKRKIEK